MQNFSFTKMYLKISSAKWQPLCPGGDEWKRSVGILPLYVTRIENKTKEICFKNSIWLWMPLNTHERLKRRNNLGCLDYNAAQNSSLPPNSLNSPNLQTSWSHQRMPMMYIKSTIWSGFEIKNWIEDQFQSSPKLVGIWTVLRCIFVPNLEIVSSIGVELWHGQAQNGVNFDFGVQFDLQGHNQSSHKTIGLLTKVFYISGPNLWWS